MITQKASILTPTIHERRLTIHHVYSRVTLAVALEGTPYSQCPALSG
jgi:hypothetical protein